MKVLVTGAKGQLGTDLMNELEKRGIEGIGVDVQEMDITTRKPAAVSLNIPAQTQSSTVPHILQ